MAASAWSSAPARTLDFLSDERLARLAARGDQRAFGALVERHRPALVRYARTILRHAADAEDAAQNALVAAHRALEGGTVPMRVKPWLYKIAHNEAISLVRSRRPAEELDEAMLPTVADAEEAGEVRRRLGQLMTDLQALTERQREALVLRELCGMGYAEIAVTLGASEAAAQQTVFEARSALQQFDEGRALECEGVQRAMSECDGMRLRTRRVRAHLRGCAGCRDFESSLVARRRDLGLLFPPTGAAGGVLATLARIFGGGGGEPLLAGLGIKGAAIGLAVLAGGGAVVVSSGGSAERPALRGAPAASPAASSSSSSAGAAAGASARGAARPVSSVGPKRRRASRAGSVATPRPATAAATPAASSAATQVASAGSGSPASEGSAQSRGSGGGSSSSPTGGGHAKLPAGTPPSVAETVAAVTDTVTGVTDAVTETAGDTVTTVTGTAGDTVDSVTGAVDDAVHTVTGALPKLP